MGRIVVTHIRDDLCLVSHQDQTLSAHTTEHEALSAAFAFASRCIQNGDKTVVVLTKEKAPDEPWELGMGHKSKAKHRWDTPSLILLGGLVGLFAAIMHNFYAAFRDAFPEGNPFVDAIPEATHSFMSCQGW